MRLQQKDSEICIHFVEQLFSLEMEYAYLQVKNHVLENFHLKFIYFVKNIGLVDSLFEGKKVSRRFQRTMNQNFLIKYVYAQKMIGLLFFLM